VYLVSALVQDVPRPVIVVHGEHGSGKSTLFLLLRELLDPSALRPQSAPDSVREFVQAASHNLCLYLDNVSHLPDWLSDAFCRLCTGDGFSKRQLYTDDDDVIYSLRGLGGLNGINLVASRPDLLDRALILSLGTLPESERRTEEDCHAEFVRLRPYLLGAIFDALSVALDSVDDVRLGQLPRMADFARWGCAIARHLGFADDEFLTALGSNTVAQNATAIENSPVAQAVLRLMQEVSEWEDTPAATHQRLKSIAEELQVDVKSKLWPKTPSYLTRRLNEVKPNLARLGIVVTTGGHSAAERTICLRWDVSAVSVVSESGGAVSNDGTVNPGPHSERLARDGSDATDGAAVGAGASEWEVP
jgi:energy-coupling factor transporter ATP-binding protein EcfA2